jgi:hypothetical protein
LLPISADLNLPASRHGSFPNRANTETRFRVMPFASVPTGAKRNSFSPDRRKAKTSLFGINGRFPSIVTAVRFAELGFSKHRV